MADLSESMDARTHGDEDGSHSGSDNGAPADPKKPGQAKDLRLKWLREKVNHIMSLAKDKWKKMEENTVCKYAILNFLDDPGCRCLLFYLNPRSELIATLKYPDQLKGKSLYFIKSHEANGPVTAEQMNTLVSSGDLASEPLEQLSVMMDELYTPLLKNRKNHETWPQVVAQDVLRHFHKVAGSVYVINGLTQGKTLLPLPPDAEEGDDTTQDKSLIHQLESAVMEWTHQVRAVVRSSAADKKADGSLPGPLDELDFWKAKATNLQCVDDQLREEKMRKIGRVLEITRSSYYAAFQNIYDEVHAALLEAYDIHKCLSPLRPYFERMHEVDSSMQLVTLFKPLVHVLSLVWKESKYYKLPHLVVLIQEACNDLINHIKEHEVDAERIFRGEPQESVQKLDTALHVLQEFKTVFFACKNQLATELPDKSWRFDNDAVFSRLDKFTERLRDILDLMNTIVEFSKLEKVEIGGSKGKILTQNVADIFQVFYNAVQVFSSIQYDVLDVSEGQYIKDAIKFRSTISDLERQISTVISDGFDDCVSVSAAFKLLDSFHGMLQREAIQVDFMDKYTLLIQAYSRDLDEVFRVYRAEKDDPPIHANMPKVAGSVKWARSLRDRIEAPHAKLLELGQEVVGNAHGAEVMAKYDQLKKLLLEFEAEHHKKWASTIDVESAAKLALPVIRRDESSKKILVNFDPALVILLREVKYLEHLELTIPPAAGKVYSDGEQFRQYISTLDGIVNQYNTIITTVLDVERPLIEERLVQIDKDMEKGLGSITWHSQGIGAFIQTVSQSVSDLSRVLGEIKARRQEIENMVNQWSQRPLVERKDAKRFLEIDECTEKLRQRSLEIELQGTTIHKLLKESREVLAVDTEFEPWQAYAAHVNAIVSKGFYETVRNSLQYLHNNMDPDTIGKNDTPPLFEISLVLREPEVVFEPPLNSSERKDLKQIFITMMNGFLDIGKLVKRLDVKASKATYFAELAENHDLQRLRDGILHNIQSTVDDCINWKNDFHGFQDFWLHDRDDFMQQFLLFGPKVRIGDDELNAEDEQEETPPSLEDFAREINTHTKNYEQVQAWDNNVTFHWLRVDAKPFKNALATILQKWKYMFTGYLHKSVTDTIAEFNAFIDSSTIGLNKEVKENDYAQLVASMSLLRDIRARIDAAGDQAAGSAPTAMFRPLYEKITLLKEYGLDIPQEDMEHLNDLPQKWQNLIRKFYAVKESLTPLQQTEVSRIKDRRTRFQAEVAKFRADFLKAAPLEFEYETSTVYTLIDEWNAKTQAMEKQALLLGDQEDMFELSITKFPEIQDVRKDLCSLKALWDLISLVRFQFDEWKQTLWMEVNIEAVEDESKAFQRVIRTLPRDCRSWGAYSALEAYIKNLIKSMGSVSQLRSKSMRTRHWRALMKTTGVHFDMGGEVKLEDLLALQLHKFDDIVKNIVSQSQLELSMEKQLGDLESIWKNMDLSFGTYKKGTPPTLKPMETLMETLEENMTSLQNMMGSKFSGYFHDKISEWLNRLVQVDSVIHRWLEVQHDWMHLEPIFIDSEDIKSQLEEDSNRFARVDKEWKQIMVEATKTPNVVQACAKPNLYDQLGVLQSELVKCSKALDDYLERKRLLFPRFYFISNSDLLDILANGNNPQDIMKHLFKLFDNLVKVEFEKDHEGHPTKNAIKMFSTEGEAVDLVTPCDCSGQVEVWLNRLVDVMRATLRKVLSTAVETYEEKSREEWIMEYPAQIALAGVQIFWTTEVNQAFDRLVEGYDNALKEYNKKQIAQLNKLIEMLQGSMQKGDRQKVMTICTIDTHNREIIRTLAEEKAESASCFGWQSQLRARWDEEKADCYFNICDAEFQYQYEYLGNTPRLVITPLTDRCYITLTQSLRLFMGGAPAGPAGTGKTETTKDLGRALGIRVLVQNCSPTQTFLDMANIFKGLAQSGMWGCFDEFNRISIEVLSVVATQVKSILEAVRHPSKNRFMFQGEEIKLVRTVGLFITMNPGYAGRTELPDNLKSLFRPVSMVVPDLGRICEIMLISEGFVEAQELAIKFTTLYGLTRDLLSKQRHYDWGLRAIKSVLVVAGELKRAEPKIPERYILMRALRDFNLPKIITEDVQVFRNLIDDLFPKIELDRKVNASFEQTIHDVAVERGLQPEKAFIVKVVQLEEILQVRHSVFIIGPSGSGKTEVWRTLAATFTKLGRKTMYRDLNPKAVDNNELYGYRNPVTKEFMDGLFSYQMRELSKIQTDDPKWIVLDGDIDPDWIESLNTLMDDNKILTLNSKERILLTPSMRLLFEVGNVAKATPATVSRAGILFLNESDLGWGLFQQSWVDRRENVSEKSNLTVLFDRYCNSTLEYVRKNFKQITPVSDFQMIQTLCYMLDGLLVPENVPAGSERDVLEIYFVFAVIWAVGGSLIEDPLNRHRTDFSRYFKSEYKNVKFPLQGTVFDYYIDPATKKWASWSDKVPAYVHEKEMPLSRVIVHTPETVRLRYWVDLFAKLGKPVMLVGGAGCGKTRLVEDTLAQLPDDFMSVTINMNYYTDSARLQQIMEDAPPLERKIKDYGPPGTKRLIYFLDDLTMPMVDKYGTQQPHALIRQHLSYGHWYERGKWEQLKNIKRCQYIACMNPTTGSFFIDPRMQRHFAVFNVSFPRESLPYIYGEVLKAHLADFAQPIPKFVEKVVNASLDLHTKVAGAFLPNATKFHYQFNMRSLSNLFQGMLNASKQTIKEPRDLCLLWIHEARRTYGDMLNEQDEKNKDKESELSILQKWIDDGCRRYFDDPSTKLEALQIDPNMWCHFATGSGDTVYGRVKDYASVNKTLVESLASYNDSYAEMDLVLFKDAMEHVTRISRIIVKPNGNAILIGVGGSGKQSLARLAAHINNMEVVQIQITQMYGVNELKLDIQKCYQKAGVKGDEIVFLLSDAQIVDEKFLIYINDILSTGKIPGLFEAAEVDNIVNSLRSEVKQAGIIDTKPNVWEYFIAKVRRHLHVVLCMSPGDTLRNRYRKFPAIINCTEMDQFHSWPNEALLSVANYFLASADIEPNTRGEVVEFIAFADRTVKQASVVYEKQYRRFNYNTPKSFLELIKLYKNMLNEKKEEIVSEKRRLESGLERLQGAAEQVANLHKQLAVQQVDLQARSKVVDEVVVQLGKDQAKVQREREAAAEEEKKTQVVQKEVAQRKADCDLDLRKAEPILAAAQAALNSFSRADVTELARFSQPPAAVMDCLAAVMVLQSPEGRLKRDLSWKAARTYMTDVGKFYDSMVNFDKDNIPQENIAALRPYLTKDYFNQESMQSKSTAAAGICAWIINMVEYNKVYLFVKPKRDLLAEATANLQAAEAKLEAVNVKLRQLEATLNVLTEKYEKANEERMATQREAEKTRLTIELANRLVSGLSNEKTRWEEEVQRLDGLERTLVGDVLLAAGFISYIGAFNRVLREDIMTQWMDWIGKSKVPLMKDYSPLRILTADATVARWNNDGLPSDRVSIENASVCTSCQRWPLLVDPQLQGITWLKNRSDLNNLHVIRQDQKDYLNVLSNAIESGEAVLIEGVTPSIDPMLDPLLARNFVRKGKAIRVGGKEVDYNPNFRLFLQTKLGNPHFKPELQAQTTLINFTVTEDGLEEQLLAMVVKHERPDLEERRTGLIRQLNEFEIKLKELEQVLLSKLQEAKADFLSDTTLVENLETTKATADDIKKKKAIAQTTQESINKSRDLYRPVASRAALLYFLLNDLSAIDDVYQFSLKAFVVVFLRAIERLTPIENEDLNARTLRLVDQITYEVYLYASRGLFERDKLIFTTLLCFRILAADGKIDGLEMDYLLRGPVATGPNVVSPLDWCKTWGSVIALKDVKAFAKLPDDIEGSSSRWKKWWEEPKPEIVPMPQDWKSKTPLQKLCIIRALRPDRLINALQNFIAETEQMGKKYTEAVRFDLNQTFAETLPSIPMLFILSPGVDPVREVEALGRRKGLTAENGRLKNVSLGQGQEKVAMECLEYGHKEGAWVILQNIHLMLKWLPQLEKKLEELSNGTHEDFRVFLSAEPVKKTEDQPLGIPISILQNSIKVTNEPPRGMKANMHRALDSFTQENLEQCSKESEFHTILFTMCFFHAVVLERRKFGPQGWNKPYNFNTGDLTISVDVLNNYLENNTKIPWEDLRYMFGEIMYGGHISDDWDRRLCRTYLQQYIRPELLDENLELTAAFPPPPHGNMESYHKYIEEVLPVDDPSMFGMSRNAEIGFLTEQSTQLFRKILELQPQASAGGGTESRDDKVEKVMKFVGDNFTQADGQVFNKAELYLRTDDKRDDPYVVVALQECDRINVLIKEIKASLKDLDLGMRGELTMSDEMERLAISLFNDVVPTSWADLAYPSLKPLMLWLEDLVARVRQLEKWVNDFKRPNVVYLSYLFNPASFLTAIMQYTARKTKQPLDKMRLQTDVIKKSIDDVAIMAKTEGAYVTGLFLEGAVWDTGSGQLVDASPKETLYALPIVYIKAITVDKVEERDMYACPVYRTRQRGPTYVWTFNLRTKQPPAKWTLAGTSILLSGD